MRILIVEDEKNIADSIKKGLEQEAYSVDIAYEGDVGYDLLLTEEYDLAVLDVMLPGMDGFTISKKIREGGIEVPIIMLTAKSELEDRLEGFNDGADDYLAKPFHFEELLARVKALLRRPKNKIGEILKCGDITLNTNTFEVSRGMKNIELSKTEFSLLLYLMRNKNTIVTKQQLIDHVWDYDSDILPNTVEVYMGYLRKKIDKKSEIIKTRRGFGYMVSCHDHV